LHSEADHVVKIWEELVHEKHYYWISLRWEMAVRVERERQRVQKTEAVKLCVPGYPDFWSIAISDARY
jgi:hypothetical protein